MAVPDFQSLMLPLLRIAGDGKEHPLAEARERLGAEFKLTQAEQDELLPSGRQSRFANRVAWAKVYLEQGGLLLSPRRGHLLISDRGRNVLKVPPARIDISSWGSTPSSSNSEGPSASLKRHLLRSHPRRPTPRLQRKPLRPLTPE